MLPSILFTLSLLLALTSSGSSSTLTTPQRRLVNSTALSACQALQPSSKVYYAPSPQYDATLSRFMGSTIQAPTCLFLPTQPSEIASALSVIAQRRVAFAVSSGRHASNLGFSTTQGIQIDLKGFQAVKLASDKSYVDVGTSNIWDNVYQVLEGSGVNIVGGRVSGVGVGGFLTGGGGFSWKTNQHGLSIDTLLQADMVLPNGTLITASPTQNPDVFWAILGGGNQFGIVYNWRMKTYPQSSQVYGGLRTYTQDQIPAVLKAVADFSANNTNAKAQAIPTLNTIAGVPGVSFLFFYDGPDPGSAKSYFEAPQTTAKPLTDDWKTRTFQDLVRSPPANATAGLRGLFHSVSLKSFSLPLLQQCANQSAYWGVQPLRSGAFISYDVEPFLSTWSDTTPNDGNRGAWPHSNSPLPLNLYFAWTDPLDDDFYRNAALESARILTAQAKAEGQNLDDIYIYPNYALSGTPASQVYGSKNAAKLRQLKKIYDPANIMGLTTYLPFQ